MSSFGWAVIGPGKIAHKFAEAVTGLPGTHLAAIHGRDHARAAAFASHWSRGSTVPVIDSFDELLADPDIDGVYIATPHAFHFAAAARCLAAGKPVLSEKPLTPNLAQSQELVRLSKLHNTFLMEAVWTRFLPIYAVVGEWLRRGAIGPVRAMQSSFCFNTTFDATSRLYDPAQAGGALLDIGIYNLTVTRWAMAQAFGVCAELTDLRVAGMRAESGVDRRVSAQLAFDGGVTSQFVCGVDGAAENAFHILGEHGLINIPSPFWGATEAVLHVSGQAPQIERRPHPINGFEGQIEEAIRCVARGAIESPTISHAETLATVAWMDRMRAVLGVRYPFEA